MLLAVPKNVVNGGFVSISVGDDFEDVDEDDNMDEEQPEDEAQIDLLERGEATSGQAQSKRITTPYMTKYKF